MTSDHRRQYGPTGLPQDMRKRSVLLREVRAATSEKMLRLREDELSERELALTRRDVEAGQLAQALADYKLRMSMLQEANGQLVIATLEARDLAEQVEAAKAKLDHMAHHDSLTGLPNRVLMHDRLAQAIALAERNGTQLALMFMDLDGFKHINDSLGHAVGDKLLCSVAQRLQAGLRQSDTVSRQGGDEFVLLLSQIDSVADATVAAQKVLRALDAAHHIDGHAVRATASIGISVYPASASSADGLMRCADAAMFDAKQRGHHGCQLFDATKHTCPDSA